MPDLLHTSTLCCLAWLSLASLLRSEFQLVYLMDHSLLKCLCARELPSCGDIDMSQCNCWRQPLSALRRPRGPGTMHTKCLTVWYTSPLHVAPLLNNSEVRHLQLVKCATAGGSSSPAPTSSPAPPSSTTSPSSSPFSDYFAVQRLERLTFSYLPGQNQDILLGRTMEAQYREEARIAFIQTSALLGKARLKAYTVHTYMDRNGMPSFPDLLMAQDGTMETSSVFVTFLY